MARMKDVNTTDIADAVRLGCRTMQNVFNADDNGVPTHGRSILPLCPGRRESKHRSRPWTV